MTKYPIQLTRLISTLKRLPGVGSRTAERYAFQLLGWQKPQLIEMARLIEGISEELKPCSDCGCIMDRENCFFCSDEKRDTTLLCVIATAREAFAIDATKHYRGLFHVIGGLLSPLEGRGVNMLELEKLKKRIQVFRVKEVVIALDSTLEGDATAHFLKAELEAFSIQVSRLAMGLPMGSSLEFIDGSTLSQALSGRRLF